MTDTKIIYLALNLPASQERRDNLKIQAEKFGIDIKLIEAVSGATLTEEQKSMYRPTTRALMYPTQLRPNEQAYLHSYRKALQTFLDSPAEYGVIMDDDVVLHDIFPAGLSYILEKVGGWELCKLYQPPCKLYEVFPDVPGAPVKPVFPRKITCVSVCYMYSRKAATILLEKTKTFYMEGDPLIAKILMDNNLPTISTYPNLAGTLYPNNEQSDIDAAGSRRQTHTRRNLLQYICYRFKILNFTLAKMRMLKLVRRSLYTK